MHPTLVLNVVGLTPALLGPHTVSLHVRRGDYPEEQISVYFTVRQYGSLTPGVTFEETLVTLRENNERLLDQHIIEQVLRPLAQAISAK